MLSEVYLMCSLPSLSFGQAPPLSMEDFLEEASGQLSKKQLRLLEEADIRMLSAEKKGAFKALDRMLASLQKDLADIREARGKKRRPRPEALPRDVFTGNPLQREKAIMKWQWEELAVLESGREFSLKQAIIYKLRLQLLLRMDSFTKDRGEAVLDSVVNPSEKMEA